MTRDRSPCLVGKGEERLLLKGHSVDQVGHLGGEGSCGGQAAIELVGEVLQGNLLVLQHHWLGHYVLQQERAELGELQTKEIGTLGEMVFQLRHEFLGDRSSQAVGRGLGLRGETVDSVGLAVEL